MIDWSSTWISKSHKLHLLEASLSDSLRLKYPDQAGDRLEAEMQPAPDLIARECGEEDAHVRAN